MTPEDKEAHLRRYLLGILNEEEQQSVEQRLLMDSELFDVLLAEEDDLVDDYLSGDLSGDERLRFDSVFLTSPERRRKLSLAMALRRYVTAEAGAPTAQSAPVESSTQAVGRPARVLVSPLVWWKQTFSSPYLRMALAAVIVLGLGFGIWRVFVYQSEVARGLAALAKAFRQERPLEARILGLGYAPLPNTRGGEQPKVDELSLNRAERILLDEVTEHPSPASHHAAGRFYLAEKKFDKAIAQFDEALKGEPDNAYIHADYGAALLEKGKADRLSDDSGKGLEELAKSLEHLNKALELNDELLEALFNRALVHQEMILPQQAEEDWRRYLDKDSASNWADEARRNLALLEEPRRRGSRTKEEPYREFMSAYLAGEDERAWRIIRQSRDGFSSGKLVREQLLDAYLASPPQGSHNEAESGLRALKYLGHIELERTSDTYTSGLAEFYESSPPSERENLRQARELMKLGQQYYGQAKPLDAIRVLTDCKRLFERSGDRWEAQYAQLWIAYCHMGAANTQISLAMLEQLGRSFERQEYKWLLMRTFHLLSGAEYNVNEYSKAIEHNLHSLALAEEMDDAIGIFNTSSILAEQYRYIGSYSQSMRCIERSLSSIDSCELNEIQIAQCYFIASSSLASAGLFSGAAAYVKEAVRRALTTGHVQLISRSYAHLGLLYGKMGNYSEGLSAAKLAFDSGKSHSDESIRRGIMAFSSLQIGDLYRDAGDIENAIRKYDQCLDLYKNSDFSYGLYEAHKNRLVCFIAQGRDLEAKEELQATLSLVEKYRSKILEGENRNNFFDAEQNVYDIGIDFEHSRMHNSERAFEYSEESRSRSLLDLVNENGRVSGKIDHPDIVFDSVSQPLKLSDLHKRLPEEAQIIQYAVLSDRVFLWVITKTTFSTFERPITQQQLTERVRKYIELVSDKSGAQTEEARDDARQLYEVLIKPAEPLLDRSKPVYVIPDKILNYLPFSTLVSPDSNRFLIEDYLTIVSPSSSLLVICSEIARKKQGNGLEKLLSVGNPRFSRTAFPGLAELPAAANEAEVIASYYKSRCILTGVAATKERVLAEMQRADVIHLALHFVVDPHSPLRSKMLLTKEAKRSWNDESDGGIESHEIYGLKLPRTRLVIASACQSGVERYYRGEGMMNLARPFIAAGVPLIVASFWPVDSDSTAELMIRFHKYRKYDELSTPEALRRAQLEMLGSSEQRFRQPNCWASFTAIGGSTSF